MKTLSTVPFYCFLLLARSSSAIPNNFDHVEAEDKLQQRTRDLNDDTPLNEDEISSLKRMLSTKTLRVNDDVSNYDLPNSSRRLVNDKYANDPLAKAMHNSALAKLKTRRRTAGRREVRGTQDSFDSRKLKGNKEPPPMKEPKDSKEPKAPKESSQPKDLRSPKEDPQPKVRTLPKPIYPNEDQEDTMQGRMGVVNESSEIHIESTTRSGGYRNDQSNRNGYYEYGNQNNGNRNGNRNQYYGQGNNRHSNNQNQETTWEPPRQRAEIPEKVSMVLEAFQDSRMLQEPVLAGSSYLSPGTQYLFVNEPLFNVVYDVPPGSNKPFYLVNERDKIATVSGECLRTDPKIKYVGKSYCQFEYNFLDSSGNVEASLTASGPVSKGDIDTLAITGGSGIFRRTVGTVILQSGNLKRGSPPFFVEDPTLDLPSSYLVKMFVFLDSVDLELAQSS